MERCYRRLDVRKLDHSQPEAERTSMIGLAFFAQYRSVTDCLTERDRHTYLYRPSLACGLSKLFTVSLERRQSSF